MASPLQVDLQRQIDPKLAWALDHREHFPVDVNRAPREMLLRVPGLSERAVARLLDARRERPIAAADFRRLRVNWYQVRYFVATADHCPRQRVPENQKNRPAASIAPPTPTGLPLFDAAASGGSFIAA
jgi:predicted DNA-binding helix-hairpin-helix protein